MHLPRTTEVQPVKVSQEEFARSLRTLALEVKLSATPRETVRRMFQLDALSGDYLYLPRDRKLVPTGKVIGRDAARAFAMLAMAAINQTAQGFSAKVQTLPGSAQVAMQAEAQGGIWLPAVSEVKELAVTAEGFGVALPPGAVAMAAGRGRTEKHHIGTISNEISTAMVGKYASVRDMRIDKAKVGSARVLRPEGWATSLIVSEEIKDALEQLGATGAKFEEV